MKTIIYSLSAMAIAASLSLAQAPPQAAGGPEGAPLKRERQNPEEAFKKLDTNGDGSLSLDEFKAGPRGLKDPAKAEEIFKKMDKDSDGKVTLEEFKAFRPQRRPGGADAPEPGGATPPPAPPEK